MTEQQAAHAATQDAAAGTPSGEGSIASNDPRLIAFLEALGVKDALHTQRIIIDLPVADIVKVYVTRPADPLGFDLRFRAGEFEIIAIDKPVVDGEIDMTSRADGGWKRTQRV